MCRNHERDYPGSGDRYSTLNAKDSGGECGVVAAKRFPMPYQAYQKHWWETARILLLMHQTSIFMALDVQIILRDSVCCTDYLGPLRGTRLGTNLTIVHYSSHTNLIYWKASYIAWLETLELDRPHCDRTMIWGNFLHPQRLHKQRYWFMRAEKCLGHEYQNCLMPCRYAFGWGFWSIGAWILHFLLHQLILQSLLAGLYYIKNVTLNVFGCRYGPVYFIQFSTELDFGVGRLFPGLNYIMWYQQ